MMYDHLKNCEMEIKNKGSCVSDQWVLFSSLLHKRISQFLNFIDKGKAKIPLNVGLIIESIIEFDYWYNFH